MPSFESRRSTVTRLAMAALRLILNHCSLGNFAGAQFCDTRRAPRGMLKRPTNQAAGKSKPEAYPQRYVEDFDEPRGSSERLLYQVKCALLDHEPVAIPHCTPHASRAMNDALRSATDVGA